MESGIPPRDNRHDLDALLALCDPNVVFISRHLGLEGGGDTHHGHDAVGSRWESLLGIFPDFSTELDEVRDLGDVTVTRHQLHGRGIGSDSPMDQTNWDVAQWRDKKDLVARFPDGGGGTRSRRAAGVVQEYRFGRKAAV